MSHPKRYINNQDGYDIWSSFYDQYSNSTVASDDAHFPGFWEHLRGKCVLEVGCGTGRHTRRLVEQQNTVVGIDLSMGMLDQARKKLDGHPVVLIGGDFLSYASWKQSSFDAVICSLVIEHIENLEVFFRKLAFVVKPGGEAFISEIHPLRIRAGTQANFKRPGTEEAYVLESYPHPAAAIELSASHSGFSVKTSVDVFGDEAFARQNSDWVKHIGKPLIKIWHLERTTVSER